MKLSFGDEISDVGGSGVGNGGLLYSQDVLEEASIRGLVDGTSVLSGDITRVILQMDKEALLAINDCSTQRQIMLTDTDGDCPTCDWEFGDD